LQSENLGSCQTWLIVIIVVLLLIVIWYAYRCQTTENFNYIDRRSLYNRGTSRTQIRKPLVRYPGRCNSCSNGPSILPFPDMNKPSIGILPYPDLEEEDIYYSPPFIDDEEQSTCKIYSSLDNADSEQMNLILHETNDSVRAGHWTVPQNGMLKAINFFTTAPHTANVVINRFRPSTGEITVVSHLPITPYTIEELKSYLNNVPTRMVNINFKNGSLSVQKEDEISVSWHGDSENDKFTYLCDASNIYLPYVLYEMC